MCLDWTPNEFLIEDKCSGIALGQCLKDPTEKVKTPIIMLNPGSFSKAVRMENESMAIEAGLVWLPESAAWLTAFEEECQQFPMGEHDDMIDSMSMYLKRCREKKQKGVTLVMPITADFHQESNWLL
jgi:predicted phage terminase large subunit-like protein